MINNELMFLNQFDYENKKWLLNNDFNVDKGIKDLVDAINDIDVLVTMNSCQGKLIDEEKSNHCPLTYVDFYVLYHQYYIANKLFVELIHKFGSLMNCQIEYEAEFDFLDEDTVEDNGTVNLRYRIEFYPENLLNADKTYKEIIFEIKDFCKRYQKYNAAL